jgi:hypothetical protein
MSKCSQPEICFHVNCLALFGCASVKATTVNIMEAVMMDELIKKFSLPSHMSLVLDAPEKFQRLASISRCHRYFQL